MGIARLDRLLWGRGLVCRLMDATDAIGRGYRTIERRPPSDKQAQHLAARLRFVAASVLIDTVHPSNGSSRSQVPPTRMWSERGSATLPSTARTPPLALEAQLSFIVSSRYRIDLTWFLQLYRP